MKFLQLTQSAGGREFFVYERFQEGAEYLLGCDPSLGRIGSTSGDKSAIHIARRLPSRRLRQVAEWYGRWPSGRVGEVMSCLAWQFRDESARPGMVNIEANISDAMKVAMEYQGFPEDRFFIPRQNQSIQNGISGSFFTMKTNRNSRFIVETLHEYMDRGAFEIASNMTLADIASLERDDRTGNVNTRGHDRAVAAMMVCAMDQEMDPISEYVFGPAESQEPPEGVDAVLWRQARGIRDPSQPVPRTMGGAARWDRQDYKF